MVYITLPSKLHVNDCKCQNAIHVTAECDNGPRGPPSYAHFDTVLIIEDENLHRDKGGLNGMWYIVLFL